jgi:NADH-quinone oxidoreductase subunit A
VDEQVTSTAAVWLLVFFLAASIAVPLLMIVLSALLGQRHRQRTTGEPYESGMVPTGSARLRFDVKFYLMAMFFVIFDMEAVFIYAWAVSARNLGWVGYAEILIFIGFLLLALFYLWRVGALDWSTTGQRCQADGMKPRAVEVSHRGEQPWEASESS